MTWNASLHKWQDYLTAMKLHQLEQYISVIECDRFGIEAGYEPVIGAVVMGFSGQETGTARITGKRGGN